MFELICKTFITDYKKTDEVKVRERYGTVFSIFSIICNIVMVIFKLLVSFATNSISIRADAFNNMSDVGSNIATLFGFKLANRHPDKEHPYGYGRYEYLSGMVIAFLILLMAFNAIKESISKIISPEDLSTTFVAFIVLVVSIGIKLIMAYVNKKAGKVIDSDTLLAAGQDSLNDAIMTGATVISLLISLLFHINVDAYVGLIVSLFVLKAGAEIFKDIMSTILGKAPDKELIKSIEDYALKNYDIKGIHDLVMHDYGPSNKMMTFHAEVDYRQPVLELHDMIDNMEVSMMKEFGIMTTIHMDPIVTDNPIVNRTKEKVRRIVKEINPDYSIHDFRMVIGETHSNLIFDVVLPADDHTSHKEVEEKIKQKVSEYNNLYLCVITVEHSFVEF